MSKPRKKSKKILFILEIVVLLLFIGGLFVYGQISAKLDKIDIQETDLADQDIVTNDQAPQMTGYTTYALFGLDRRMFKNSLKTDQPGQGIGGRDHKYIDQHMETTEIFLVVFNQFPPPHLSSLLLSYNR